MENLSNFIAPAVIAAIVSALMSVSLPWVSWGVEKRRLRRAHRVCLIEAVRRLAQEDSPSLSRLVQTAEYSAIRKYLPDDFVKEIELTNAGNAIPIKIVMGHGRSSGTNNFRPRFFDELTKIEIKWKLI